jgi:hypothetical protein
MIPSSTALMAIYLQTLPGAIGALVTTGDASSSVTRRTDGIDPPLFYMLKAIITATYESYGRRYRMDRFFAETN